MLPKIHIVALLGGFLFLGMVVMLIRRRRLREQYAMVWLLTSVALIAFALSPGLVGAVARYMGIAYPPAALFFVAVVGLLIGSLHFSLVVSKAAEQQLRLAQRLAILEQELEQIKGGAGKAS